MAGEHVNGAARGNRWRPPWASTRGRGGQRGGLSWSPAARESSGVWRSQVALNPRLAVGVVVDVVDVEAMVHILADRDAQRPRSLTS